MKGLKQLLSKVKSGRLDKKTAKDLDNLVTRGDGFVVITKSKKAVNTVDPMVGKFVFLERQFHLHLTEALNSGELLDALRA